MVEVGHKAQLKDKIDAYGNTHRWNAFVRSGDSRHQLDKIVKKVVFNLHETFKNPMRVCLTQPYCVKENGYGQFEFPIDIYFYGTDIKYSISYYLELPELNATQPLSRVRKEIITFINPCPEFRKILIEGGGIHKIDDASSINGNNSIIPVPPSSIPSSIPSHSPFINTTIINDNNNDQKNNTKRINPSSAQQKNLPKINSTSNLNTSNSSSNSSISPNITPEKKLNKQKVINVF